MNESPPPQKKRSRPFKLVPPGIASLEVHPTPKGILALAETKPERSGAAARPVSNGTRQRQARYTTMIDGVEYTFQCKPAGLHVRRRAARQESVASWPDVLAVAVKQQTFNLI